MAFLPLFVIPILSAALRADERREMIYIIVQRPYAYLAETLQRAFEGQFEGQEDIKVMVDRRYGERRTQQRPVAVTRRRGDRRGPKQALLEVVILQETPGPGRPQQSS